VRPIRYGLSGRRARYWAYADMAVPASFYWRTRRYPAFTALKRRYLRRSFARRWRRP
jgi:hypothetical protein